MTITAGQPARAALVPHVDSPGSRWRPERANAVVWLLALGSAVGAASVGARPTAHPSSDLAAALLVGAVVVVASSRAGAVSGIFATVVVLAASSGSMRLVALAGVVAALIALRRRPLDSPVLGGLVGLLAVQVVLRLPSDRFGVNVVVSMVAVASLLVPAWTRVEPGTRATIRRASTVLGSVAALALVGLALGVVAARPDIEAGVDRAQDGLSAVRRGDGDRAVQLLGDASGAFESANDDLDAWWAQPARFLPVIGQHARSLDVLTEAGAELSLAAGASARQAGIEDLQVTDGRLDLERVRALAAPLETVQGALRDTQEEVPAARSEWLMAPVADRLSDFEQLVATARDEAETASAAVAVLPDLLGGHGRRSYFVAFGTPAETRELGGFMGAYAVLTASDGRLTLAGTGRVRDLNELLRGRRLSDPSALPQDYLAMLPQRFWHNLTATPDFPTMAETVQQLWPARALGPMDGVIYMDPVTLGDLLALTGPIRVPGHKGALTERNAADFLLREQYIAFPDDDRHDFLVDAATTVFEELTAGDLPRPSEIIDTLAPATRQRRLLLHSFHPSEQALFTRLELDGGLPDVDGDFLSVRSSNRGLNKLDAMMRRTVTYDVAADPARGRVRSTLTVRVENDAPSEGLPYGIIGNRLGEPAGTNSTTLAVYTPLGLVDVTSDGRSIARGASRPHDRNRYTVLLDVPPEGSVTVVFHLEGAMDLRDGYHLEVVPQPLVNADDLVVNLRGSGPWWPWRQRTVTGTPSQSLELRVPLERQEAWWTN